MYQLKQFNFSNNTNNNKIAKYYVSFSYSYTLSSSFKSQMKKLIKD